MNNFISPQEIQQQGETPFVVDVRSPQEYEAGHVPGAVNIPLGQLAEQLAELPTDRPIVTYCNMYQRGNSRGEQAATLLSEKGYQVSVLDGGYSTWKAQGLPIVGA